MRRVGLAMIRAYQRLISPVLPEGMCAFEPSCSHYAYEAIENYGLLRGGWLGAKRLARCNPFTEGGFDPVPDLPRRGGQPSDASRIGHHDHVIEMSTRGVTPHLAEPGDRITGRGPGLGLAPHLETNPVGERSVDR